MATPAATPTAFVCQIFAIYPEASDRIHFIKHEFTLQQCIDALELHPGLQNNVRQALQDRKQQLARLN